MPLKRIAVVLPTISLGGGTEAVGAWTIEALKEKYQVTLVTFSPVDAVALNQFYGNALGKDEFAMIRPWLPPFVLSSGRFSIMKDRVMMRYCKSRNAQFDLYLFLGEGMEFGTPGMQYMAFKPGVDFEKIQSRANENWSWRTLLRKSYLGMGELISSFSSENIRQSTTLAASDWTGKRAQELYGIDDYQVIYPPVVAPPSATAWDKRRDSFLLVARLDPGKRVDYAISILQEVRRKGFDISLDIVGRQDDSQYSDRIMRLCQENGDWVFAHGVVSREELDILMSRSRYGLNAALNEPFGTAFAEMVKAGCIVFVSNGGGHTEVVGTPQLIFDDLDDAVDKITGVLRSESVQMDLLNHLGHQGEMFSTEVFCQGMQAAVHQYFESR